MSLDDFSMSPECFGFGKLGRNIIYDNIPVLWDAESGKTRFWCLTVPLFVLKLVEPTCWGPLDKGCPCH